MLLTWSFVQHAGQFFLFLEWTTTSHVNCVVTRSMSKVSVNVVRLNVYKYYNTLILISLLFISLFSKQNLMESKSHQALCSTAPKLCRQMLKKGRQAADLWWVLLQIMIASTARWCAALERSEHVHVAGQLTNSFLFIRCTLKFNIWYTYDNNLL